MAVLAKGEARLLVQFDDSGDAGEPAERQNDGEGDFGAVVHLEFPDYGDGEDREEGISEDIED